MATAQRYVDIAGIKVFGQQSSASSLWPAICNRLQSAGLDCSIARLLAAGRPCMVGRAHSVSHAVRMQSAKARSKKMALANSAGGASQLKQVRLLGARRLSCSVVMAAANLAWTLARGVTHGELCGLMCRIRRRCRRFAAYAGSRSMPRRNGGRWRSTWLPSTASRRSRTVSRTRCSGRVASCVHSVVVVARIECIWCIWCIWCIECIWCLSFTRGCLACRNTRPGRWSRGMGRSPCPGRLPRRSDAPFPPFP